MIKSRQKMVATWQPSQKEKHAKIVYRQKAKTAKITGRPNMTPNSRTSPTMDTFDYAEGQQKPRTLNRKHNGVTSAELLYAKEHMSIATDDSDSSGR